MFKLLQESFVRRKEHTEAEAEEEDPDHEVPDEDAESDDFNAKAVDVRIRPRGSVFQQCLLGRAC